MIATIWEKTYYHNTLTDWMLAAMKDRDQDKALAGATAYLALAGDVIGGHFLTKAAVAARRVRPVGHLEQGNAEAIDAGRVPRPRTRDHRHFFFEREPREQ